MNPTTELAPFFGASADPAILRSAASILTHLRAVTSRPGSTHTLKPDHRSALIGASALLACERFGVSNVSHDAARRMSASSPAVFSWTLKKCRSILDLSPSIGGGMTPTKKLTATPGSLSASGRQSMSSPQRAPTTPTKNTPTALRFDPLNLPGSSAKKVATPLVGRKATRDLSDLRRKTSSASTAPMQETQDPSRKEPRASSADVPIVQVRPSMATKAPSIARNIADPVVTSSAASVPQTPSKQRAHPSSAPQHAATPSQTLVPPSPSRLQLTPRRQTKTVNSPSRLARTPTGQASPMHNALMKTKLESASATRMTASVKGKARALPSTSIKGAMGESLAFEGEDAEDDDLPSPSKRRRVGTTASPSAVEAAASARKGVDLAQVILDDSTSASAFPSMDVDVSATDFGTLNRPTVSARKINRLFQPLPSLPVDPYASIPAPPLVFTGPFIFYESEDRGSRVFRKMVPPDDMVWGDPYALVNSRRQTEGKSSSHNALLSILKIQPDQVAEANKKMERTKKRRLKRMKRLESGFKTEDPPEPQSTIPENTTCTWDREFGIPVDTNEESVTASLNVPDWQERLDLYHSSLPEGLQSVIRALNSRDSAGKLSVNEADTFAVPHESDRQWITIAETRGIAIRVCQDA